MLGCSSVRQLNLIDKNLGKCSQEHYENRNCSESAGNALRAVGSNVAGYVLLRRGDGSIYRLCMTCGRFQL